MSLNTILLTENAGKLRRRARLVLVVQLLALIGVVSLLLPFAIEEMHLARVDRSATTNLIVLALTLGFVVLVVVFVRTILRSARQAPRIVPYYAVKHFRSGGRIVTSESQNAFRAGFGLAADLPALDRVAESAGVTPLSRFGFADDLRKQSVEWFDLTDGIRSVETILGALPADRDAISSTTLHDLQTLRGALQKAAETQTPFALLARWGRDDYISGEEMERRQGTFWC
jgi:hypothetical protein